MPDKRYRRSARQQVEFDEGVRVAVGVLGLKTTRLDDVHVERPVVRVVTQLKLSHTTTRLIYALTFVTNANQLQRNNKRAITSVLLFNT